MVHVGPPLSCSGPRSASPPKMLLPKSSSSKVRFGAALPNRLYSAWSNRIAVSRSLPKVSVLSSKTLLTTLMVADEAPSSASAPEVSYVALLPAMVLLAMVSVPLPLPETALACEPVRAVVGDGRVDDGRRVARIGDADVDRACPARLSASRTWCWNGTLWSEIVTRSLSYIRSAPPRLVAELLAKVLAVIFTSAGAPMYNAPPSLLPTTLLFSKVEPDIDTDPVLTCWIAPPSPPEWGPTTSAPASLSAKRL